MGTPTPPLCRERISRLNNAVRRFADDCDDVALRCYLYGEWPLGDLARLINGSSSSHARAAVLCIGVLGGRAAVLPLVGALHHDDASVAAVKGTDQRKDRCSSNENASPDLPPTPPLPYHP